ncbi:TonB-dependent receptor [Pseudoalteromonas luteoviolacea]|uniref:TonB-dependent receptor domain-containing protein n=1 Tax=Pseudoalteromonas luteoviolacea TaxID=43657 RepID=UPI001B360239|nr:TonB-dependent receptor [Pseudoalteromonas luteoviolacea]MBQ4812179.1 TonB-dependent receptor [Pseudoalteromonas luteoviolacea]
MRYSKLSQSIKTSLVAGSILTTGFSQLAVAEEAGAEGKVERIEVTGSRIKRIALEGASPVTTVSAEDIKVAGITRIEDILNDMPAVFAGQTSGTANGATGTATVDLRNLGPERTLVLLNGRRLPSGSPSAGGIGADLNQIPAALVKRVDVLTGGSSATYGSDAVGGVVNFILKDDFEGFQFEYQTGMYQHNNDHDEMQAAVAARGFENPESSVTDGRSEDFTIMFGANTADGRGNVVAYATYREIDAITQDSRDFSACAMNLDADGNRACFGSGTIPDGRLTNFVDFDVKVAGDQFVPRDGTLYNYGPLNYFQRPDKRKTMGMIGHYDLNDNATVYTELSYMDNRTVAQIAPSGAFFPGGVTIHCNNPLFSDQQVKTLCTDRGLGINDTADGIFVGKRNVEGGPRQDDRRHTSTRYVFGVKGEINDSWTYDAYMNFGEVSYIQTYQNDLSITNIGRALDAVKDADGNIVCRSVVEGYDPNCVPWNIFETGKITQDQLDYLIIPLYSRGETKTKQVSGYVAGDLTDYGIMVPGTSTGLGVVLGLEHRKEELVLNPDRNFQNGDGAGQGGPTAPVSGEYDVDEFFTELNVPLLEDTSFVDTLTLELAYRYSDYSTGKTTDTYKTAFDIRFSDALGVRASYQRAVRAGNIRELFRPTAQGLFNWVDPCSGASPTMSQADCAKTGVTAEQYGKVPANPAGQYNAVNGGNPALEPEVSDTYSYGILWSPEFVEGLDIVVDYFDISVEKAITEVPEGDVHAECVAGNADSCAAISRDPVNGNLWIGTNAITSLDRNIGFIETSGIDYDITYRYDINDLGSLRFSLKGTWLDKYSTQNYPDRPADDCAGYWDRNTCAVPVPELRQNLATTWITPWDANITATVRYYGEVNEYTKDANNVVSDGPTTLKAMTYFDLAATWNATDSITLRAGINNLFDVAPPLVPNGPAGDANGNTYPGQYDALGRYLFAGATFRF